MTQQPWGQPQRGPQPYQQPNAWGGQQYPPPRQGAAQYAQPGWGAPQAQPGWGAQQPPQHTWGPPVIQPTVQASYPQAYPAMLGANAQFAPPPPPKRRDPLKIVLAIVVTVSLVALGGILFVWLTSDGTVQADYQNESYDPPPADTNPDPIPIPSSSEYETVMQSNEFYSQQIPSPVRCEIGEIDPSSATDTEVQEYLNNMTACLMRVWDTTVQDAGYTMPRPTVTVYSGTVTTKCGEAADHNAFYCSADQQVYFATNVLDIVPADLRSTSMPLTVILAHEFGHAIQGRTEILAAAKLEAYDLPEHDAYVYSRRLEVQADCLSGMYIGSVSQSMGYTNADRETAAELYYDFGDDVLSGDKSVWGNHGLGATRKAWGTKGMGTTDVGTCNTFTATDAEVR